MSALGETFRTARESQGLSLVELSERIHIRSIYLAAIEAEDWQAIGPSVYVKGFVRSYARALGLDPDAAIARIEGKAAGTTSAAPMILAPSPRGEPSRSGLPRGEQSRSVTPRGESARSGPSAWAWLGVVVAFALVAIVGYEFFVLRQSPTAPLAQASSRPNAVPTGARAATPEVRAPAKNVPKSSVAIRLTESSWLRVVVDGKTEMEGMYAAGSLRSFAGRAATVRVGNAGGVDITVNGKDLGPMGGLGDVAERSFQL